jgi:RNA recognition motif-containing protein
MKLYVGNLPFSVTEESLKEVFSAYGDVEEVSIIMDKFSGRSKGFGFVTLSNDEAAQKAVAELNDKDFQGRPLKVSEAKPMEERPKRDFDRGSRGGSSGGFGNRRSFGDRNSRGPRRY